MGKVIRGLTLKQPWASLVALGVKKIETRSWTSPYRGLLAIHSSKEFAWEDRQLCLVEPFRSALKAGPSELPLGKILAVVRLLDCVRITEENQPRMPELAFGDYTPGRFGWLLDPVVSLPEPISAKGALGLWDATSYFEQFEPFIG